METEIEVKFCDIDPIKLRQKLKKLGAVREHPQLLMRREIFDFPDGSLGKKGSWLRLRDEGSQITLSYKTQHDRTLHGTKESSTEVSDFETTGAILENLGLRKKSYQETKREKWIHRDCEVTIDTWPWVPTFVEIGGPSEEVVRKVAAELGFDWASAMHGSVETVYQMHFDVTEDEVNHLPEIKFAELPKGLFQKRK